MSKKSSKRTGHFTVVTKSEGGKYRVQPCASLGAALRYKERVEAKGTVVTDIYGRWLSPSKTAVCSLTMMGRMMG